MPRRFLRFAAPVVALAAAFAVALAGSPATAQTAEQKLAYPAAASKDPDTKATTVGTKFTVATAGKVLGVEFFRVDNQNKATTVQLWGAGTTALATASGVPSSTGWVRANFATPVTVSPGTTYIASYFAPSGKYSHRLHGFDAARTAGDLAAPVAAGLYRYGSSAAKPNALYENEDYYVTPVFVADVAAPPTTTTEPSTTTTTEPPPTSTTVPTSTTTPPPATSNCAPDPSACGYPDADNTGVPAGTVLQRVPEDVTSGQGWHYDSRGWIAADTPGAVVEGIDTALNVDVTADNVTVRNSRISATNDTFGVSIRHATGTVVRDNDFPGGAGDARLLVAVKDIYGDAHGTQVVSNDIARVSTAIQMYEGLVADNYVHDMGFRTGDHTNGIMSTGGQTLLTIRHNTVFNQLGQTDAIGLFQDFGVEANRVIDNNLVAGGGYSIYGGQNPGAPATSNIKITNNRIARIFFPNGGGFGWLTAWNPTGVGNELSGNVWDDTGAPAAA